MQLRWLALAVALALVAGGAAPPWPALGSPSGVLRGDAGRGATLDEERALPPHAQRPQPPGELTQRDSRRTAERLLAIPAALAMATAARDFAIIETAARASGRGQRLAAPVRARGPPHA